MQLVPDIEFRMARKGQQQITTIEMNKERCEKVSLLTFCYFISDIGRISMKIRIEI